MWGSLVRHASTLQAVPPSPFDPQGETRQISRVSYKRPDTWTFLFGLVLVRAPDAGAATNVTIRVDFELTVGVGRSSITLANGWGDGRGFGRLEILYTTPITQRQPFATWTTMVRTPGLEAPQSNPIRQNISSFPAEDIQCQARIFGTSGAPLLGAAFEVEAHAYFAPRTHVRPDWFGDDSLFRGNETGGT